MRALKIAGIAVAVPVLTLLLTALWIKSVAERRMAQMELKVKALHDEVRARDTSRAPRGPALPGNAWEDYGKAFADSGADHEAFKRVEEFLRRDPKAQRAKAEAVVASHSAALDHLRRGVRRERGEYPSPWEQGSAMKIPGHGETQRLATLAAARARLLAESGMAREAVELLLDTCQFARDRGSNAGLFTELSALGIYWSAFEELREIVLSGRLSREDLLGVDRALEGVDRDFPKTGHSLLNESLWLGYQLLQTIGEGKTVDFLLEERRGRPLQRWRYGFSERLVAAHVFDEALAAMRRLAAIDAKPWGEAQQLVFEVQMEFEPDSKQIAPKMLFGISVANFVQRQRKAELRMLRTATRYRATGEILELDDPFGAKLLHAEKDGKLKVWSVGKNGKDDGGSGEGTPSERKDIVLEIPR